MSVREVLSAMGDPTRQRILELLKSGQLSAGVISESLSMKAPAVSYHLKKLKEAGVIYETRFGNEIRYDLNLTVIDDVAIWVTGLSLKNKQKTSRRERTLEKTEGAA